MATATSCAGCELAHQRDLVAAVARLRRLLDLDADPVAVDAALGTRPGARRRWSGSGPACARPVPSTGSNLPFGRWSGSRSRSPGRGRCLPGWSRGPARWPFADEPDRLFPTAAELAAVEPSELPMPKARARNAARAGGGAAQPVRLRSIREPIGTPRARRCSPYPASVPGRPDYLLMRALGDPDVLARLRPRRAAGGRGAGSRPDRRTPGLGAVAVLRHPPPMGSVAVSPSTVARPSPLTRRRPSIRRQISMRYTVHRLTPRRTARGPGRRGAHRLVPAHGPARGVPTPILAAD